MKNSDLESMRKNYEEGFPTLSPFSSPFFHFENWFDAFLSTNREEKNAMQIATVDDQGIPDIRVVLLKSFSEKGLTFYTNYDSKKGKDLERNPFISINFYWFEQNRQVRIKGKAEKLSSSESDQYFYSRPLASQKGAIASAQSSEIDSFEQLQLEFSKLEPLAEVNRPQNWGGYRVIPFEFEFWQGRPSRLHERLVYSLNNGKWHTKLLAP